MRCRVSSATLYVALLFLVKGCGHERDEPPVPQVTGTTTNRSNRPQLQEACKPDLEYATLNKHHIKRIDALLEPLTKWPRQLAVTNDDATER